MKCPECGSHLNDDSRFCGFCGFKLTDEAAVDIVDEQIEQNTQTDEDALNHEQDVVNHEYSNILDYQQGNVEIEDSSIVFSSLKDGWAAAKNHFLMIYAMLIFVAIVELIPNFVFGEDFQGLTISTVLGIFTGIISAGFLWSMLKMVRGEEIEFENLFDGFKMATPLIIVGVVFAVISIIFFVPSAAEMNDSPDWLLSLLALPGFIIYLGLSQAYLLVIDKNLNGIEALKASWQMMLGYKLKMIGFIIVLAIFNFLGVLAIIVGLFVTLPVSLVAHSAFYNRLLKLNPPKIER